MSKTDKDRPGWVQQRDNLRIDHDHRDGRCEVETLEHTRWQRGGGRAAWRHRNRACKKLEWVTGTCEDRPWKCWPVVQGLGCSGHTYSIVHEDWFCHGCEVIAQYGSPTCTPEWPATWRKWYDGGVPNWARLSGWYKPERTRERLDLRTVAREYNAGEDVDDFDFPNFQHRHEAGWWYY